MSTATARKVVKNMIKIKLGEYLEEHEISLNWVAEATGIRYATLSAIKNNQIEKINLNYLDMIMEVLNIKDMNLLLERTDEYV